LREMDDAFTAALARKQRPMAAWLNRNATSAECAPRWFLKNKRQIKEWERGWGVAKKFFTLGRATAGGHDFAKP